MRTETIEPSLNANMGGSASTVPSDSTSTFLTTGSPSTVAAANAAEALLCTDSSNSAALNAGEQGTPLKKRDQAALPDGLPMLPNWRSYQQGKLCSVAIHVLASTSPDSASHMWARAGPK